MKGRSFYLWIGITTVCLLAIMGATAVMAMTPAGTRIEAASTAKYYSSAGALMPTAGSNTVTTTVGQIASVAVSPTSGAKAATPGVPAEFALSVTNKGNGTDAFDLLAAPQSGSVVVIYRDDNGDGVRQSTETTQVASTGSLAPDSAYKCLVSVRLPSDGSVTSDTIVFTCKSRYDATKSAQSVLTVQGAAAYIRTWLINGYYPKSDSAVRLSTDYLGGEANVIPAEGDVSGGKTWLKLDSSTDFVNLAKAFNSPLYCAAYACVYVHSPVAQTTSLWVGSNDGVKIWLNGKVVWVKDAYRSFVIDKDKTTVNLPEGWSRLLVKVSQGTGSWGFSAKFCNSAGSPIPSLQYSTAPPPTRDTTAPTISNLSITPGITSATIAWDTDEPATTIVQYGLTSELGESLTDEALVTQHSLTLSDLNQATTYYVKVGSADASGNIAWDGSRTFKTTSPPTTTSPYILTWLVNGYYPNSDVATRLSRDYLSGEAKVIPTEGTASGGKIWFRLDSSALYIDLAKTFGYPIRCAGYAHAYIYSPQAQTVNMWVGSNDGVKIWLNGVTVWTKDALRSFVADKDKTTISLPQGWSRLLVKISQDKGSWGFSVRICDSAGNPIPGIAYAAVP